MNLAIDPQVIARYFAAIQSNQPQRMNDAVNEFRGELILFHGMTFDQASRAITPYAQAIRAELARA